MNYFSTTFAADSNPFNNYLMKTITLIAILLTTCSFAFGQTFEGKIVYQNEYKSKIANVSNEQFNTMMGTKQEYFIKGGNYKSVANGTFLQWILYINKDNKLYSKLSNAESIFWNDGAVSKDQITKTEINKGVVTILGNLCDEIIFTTSAGSEKYYFNAKVGVDPKILENHKFGNWSEFVSKSKALPLKVVVDNQQFIMESVALEIVAMKLDDKLFELPADAKLEKSPF